MSRRKSALQSNEGVVRAIAQAILGAAIGYVIYVPFGYVNGMGCLRSAGAPEAAIFFGLALALALVGLFAGRWRPAFWACAATLVLIGLLLVVAGPVPGECHT